jgi:drug/metabolite transporter (DMT)-like permease
MGPLTFIAVRFLIAGLALLAWYAAKRKPSVASSPGALRESPVSRDFLLGGLYTGFALFFSYATQTLGLVTVAAGKAAFITGLYVVMVPVASRAFLRSTPDRASVIGVAVATVGLGLMSLKLPLQIAPGDFLVFLCAIGFSAHILLVGRYSERGDTVLFAAIQLLVVSAGSFVYAAIAERPLVVPPAAWGAILFTAIAATSFAFLAQTAVQRFTSATHTALIFSAEPVFGAAFAWLAVGEVLTGREIVGAVCILGGMLISESSVFRKPQQQQS